MSPATANVGAVANAFASGLNGDPRKMDSYNYLFLFASWRSSVLVKKK
jgi:hypothetical protein